VPKPRFVSGEPPTEPNFIRQTGGTEQVRTGEESMESSPRWDKMTNALRDVRGYQECSLLGGDRCRS
jgi:hypothetical protein